MVAVRRARVDDLSALLDLVRSFYVADRHDFDEARVRSGLEPLLVDDVLGQVWVLAEGGDSTMLHGYAVVTWGWSLESGGRESLLDEIYVSDQGAGRGAELMRAALSGAAAAGARTMFLETEAHNTRVRRFYARHGFATEDSVWMSADLS